MSSPQYRPLGLFNNTLSIYIVYDCIIVVYIYYCIIVCKNEN